MLITVDLLRQRLNNVPHGCDTYKTRKSIEVFVAEWPDGAEVTRANIWRANELNLDLCWFAEAFLIGEPLRIFQLRAFDAQQRFIEAVETPWQNYLQAKGRGLRIMHLGWATALIDAWQTQEGHIDD